MEPNREHDEAPPPRPKDAGLGARVLEALRGPPGWLDGAPATRAILWANIVVFAGQVYLARSTHALAEMPGRILLLTGANAALATFREARIETLVTSCFLHVSIVHIAFNLYALRQIGPPVERAVGPTRLLPMYLIAGLVGSTASAATGLFSGHERLSAGASGAICGIIGAALVLGYRAQGWKSPLARAMARWLAMLLVLQFVANLAGAQASFDNSAHFGGAFTGAAFAALWRPRPAPSRGVVKIVGVVSALMVALSFAVVAYRDKIDPFAAMGVAERFELASRAIDGGQCDIGFVALRRAARLLPEAPPVLALQNEYRLTCGESPAR